MRPGSTIPRLASSPPERIFVPRRTDKSLNMTPRSNLRSLHFAVTTATTTPRAAAPISAPATPSPSPPASPAAAIQLPEPNSPGSLHLLIGCMFSGKTGHLIQMIMACQRQSIPYVAIKHRLDAERCSSMPDPSAIIDHNGKCTSADLAESTLNVFDILRRSPAYVFIDEAQFFDRENLLKTVVALMNADCQVVLAYLDTTWKAEQWPGLDRLLQIASTVTKFTSTCSTCGNVATLSRRVTDDQEMILVGKEDKYAPACFRCHPYTSSHLGV